MAHYRVEIKICGRSAASGRRSSRRDAAYRSGSCLVDHRTGTLHDFRLKPGVERVGLFGWALQEGEDFQAALDRLWQAVEDAAKRSDARTHMELIISLPHELTLDQSVALAKRIAVQLREQYDIAGDWAIHAPVQPMPQWVVMPDPRNRHLHLGGSLRTLDETGSLGPPARGLQQWRAFYWIREMVAEVTNAHLAAAGHLARVDHRSLADRYAALNSRRAARGMPTYIAPRPTIHLGESATRKVREGEPVYLEGLNASIETENAAIRDHNHRAHAGGLRLLELWLIEEACARQPGYDLGHKGSSMLAVRASELGSPTPVSVPPPSLEDRIRIEEDALRTVEGELRAAQHELEVLSARRFRDDKARAKSRERTDALVRVRRELQAIYESKTSVAYRSAWQQAQTEAGWAALLEDLQKERRKLVQKRDRGQGLGGRLLDAVDPVRARERSGRRSSTRELLATRVRGIDIAITELRAAWTIPEASLSEHARRQLEADIVLASGRSERAMAIAIASKRRLDAMKRTFQPAPDRTRGGRSL